MRDLELTTFIIPSIRRDTLQRTIDSVRDAPYLVGYDDKRIGEGKMRDRLIRKATTPWVSFVDDDDTVTEDYVQRLQEEIEKNPDADLIYFRMYNADSGWLSPQWPVIRFGIGMCFSVKREVAMEFPFESEPHEDLRFVERLEEAGKKIVFSTYITYKIRH